MKTIFVTGIGTGVGKTVCSAIVVEALKADYWKPVQSGYEDGTDAAAVASLVSNDTSRVHPEVYNLRLPASPHIAAREEQVRIEMDNIVQAYRGLNSSNPFLVVEGAGGIMVPINEEEFILDMAKALGASVLIVSRNYLGSINHSLLTANILRQHNVPVLGWLFNDRFMEYEDEVVKWSGYPKIGSIPFSVDPDREFIREQALQLAPMLKKML